VCLTIARVAHADYESERDPNAQCDLVAIEAHPDLIHFCEPCGGAPRHHDRKVRASRAIATSTAGVFLDPIQSLDLAYAYIRISEHRYLNVAALAGCPTRGVSPLLRVDASGIRPEPAVRLPAWVTGVLAVLRRLDPPTIVRCRSGAVSTTTTSTCR
jgi:hypothetical protein